MTSRLVIRRATVDDATIIARHRVNMFTDMGLVATEALASALRESSAAILAAELGEQTYVGWLALEAAHVVGGAGIHFMPQMPRIASDGAHVVTDAMPVVQNVYTEPAWRHQGVARALMATVMQWAAARKLDRLVLQASDAGRPLYEALGFAPTREMGWNPNQPAGSSPRD